MNKFINLAGNRIKIASIETYAPVNEKSINIEVNRSTLESPDFTISFSSVEERDAAIQGLDIICNCVLFSKTTF